MFLAMSFCVQMFVVSPTECFLNYLTIPEDENTPVDLRQSAVVIMAHLDRLCVPYLPPSSAQKVGYHYSVHKFYCCHCNLISLHYT